MMPSFSTLCAPPPMIRSRLLAEFLTEPVEKGQPGTMKREKTMVAIVSGTPRNRQGPGRYTNRPSYDQS